MDNRIRLEMIIFNEMQQNKGEKKNVNMRNEQLRTIENNSLGARSLVHGNG